MMQFHHLGIVCRDLADGRKRLDALLGGLEWSPVYQDDIQNVFVQFGIDASNIRYELIVPQNERSPVSTVLQQGKNILNHTAYLVPSLEAAAVRLREQSCLPIGPAQPAVAFNGALIQFFVCPLRFVIELIEAPDLALNAMRKTT